MIADAVALAVNRAFDTGQSVRIKLDTIRLGTDLWQQYEVKFDVPGKRVVVGYGRWWTPPESDPGHGAREEKTASAPLCAGSNSSTRR